MAESKRYVPNQSLDLDRIVTEAQHRWLRPNEICEILRNHQRFQLRSDPPVRPPAGSLFLFDRKVIRYFRKDGYRWRKKKDGKTVKEAHEKLKANSVDVLHCYYAHGEENENFQRRSYWMLDTCLEHIVLVHYREVKEGYKSGISRLMADPGSQAGSTQSCSVPCPAQANSPASTVQTSYPSSPNRFDRNGRRLSSEFEDVDSGHDPQASSLVQPIFGSTSHSTSMLAHEVAGFPEITRNSSDIWFSGSKYHGSESSNWAEINSLNVTDGVHGQKFFKHPTGADFITRRLTDARLDTDSSVQDVVTCGNRLITDKDNQTLMAASQGVVQVPQERGSNLVRPQVQNCSDPHVVVTSTIHVEKKSEDGGKDNNETVGLKKLDSFGRWMDKEIGVDCDDSLMGSDSGNYWNTNTLDAENDEKEVSSLSHHMQMEINSLGPSLSQQQVFTIHDFAPDWTYSGDTTEDTTKVLIVGNFLVSKELSSKIKWGCMFGEIEVSAEVLSDTVIRCHTPKHAPGRVPFYVTCSNRLACSEVREFEYREKPSGNVFPMAIKNAPEDEVRIQVRIQMRLAKLLNLAQVRKWLDCSIQDCDKCKLKSTIYSMRCDSGKDWGRVDETSLAFNSDHMNPRDRLIQSLFKDRLYEWLICKVHEGGRGTHVLDNEGQGVIHLAAALGYEWAMRPIVAVGVSPNFRDAHGRTGLHWASYFGREETVITLLRLGAAPGAVEDPTSTSPGGKTAADLASSRGHKGIAGYLAEADLTTHLSSLTFNENVMDSVAATIAAEKAIETAAQIVPSDMLANENLSFKGSLAAVRKSAHAAALIHAEFRLRSFNHRQLAKSNNDIPEASSLDLVALGSLTKVRKFSNCEDYLHTAAAIKIQQRYRGWKGRKEFLKIRNRIVKIQAHVRGHQVRKQYKKVVWSVSIVEKAILRWRRKRSGLRGFRVEKAKIEKTDEYEFLRIGRKQKYAGVEKALARVRSMVRYPEARDQYMRLATKFENLKMGDGGSGAILQGEISQMGSTVEDLAVHSQRNLHSQQIGD